MEHVPIAKNDKNYHFLLTTEEKHDIIKSVTVTDFVTSKKIKKEAYKLFIKENQEENPLPAISRRTFFPSEKQGGLYYGKVCM